MFYHTLRRIWRYASYFWGAVSVLTSIFQAGAVSIRFRILELTIVITIMGAIVIYVIQIHMVLRSIGLVAIPAISTIACVLSTEVRALFHRARTWVVQGLRARKQLLSWALLWIMPTGFLEGIVHNAARHQLDLTPGRDDIDLEDVAIYWNETFSSEV